MGEDRRGVATSHKDNTLSLSDLFPPEGHLYLTKERIAELRELAMSGPSDYMVGIERRTLLELICDWKNLQPDFEELPPSGSQGQDS